MSQKAQHPDDFANRFDSAFARLQVAVLGACSREARWPDQIAAAITAGLRFAATDPVAARTLVSEAKYHPGDRGRRYRRLLEHFAELLGADAPRDSRRPSLTEQALVGALATMTAENLHAGEPHRMRAIVADLVEFVLIPYLGHEQAGRCSRLAAAALDSRWPFP